MVNKKKVKEIRKEIRDLVAELKGASTRLTPAIKEDIRDCFAEIHFLQGA